MRARWAVPCTATARSKSTSPRSSEQGISPLRLSTDEDRKQVQRDAAHQHDRRHLAQALISELRSFLLREESGLSDTPLTRMRGNLDACRRTRVEVSEAQRSGTRDRRRV